MFLILLLVFYLIIIIETSNSSLIDLNTINSNTIYTTNNNQSFSIYGLNNTERIGYAFNQINGDFNNDGYDDMIIRTFDEGSQYYAYLIYGNETITNNDIDLNTLTIDKGFKMQAGSSSDDYYQSVDFCDINNDNFDDLLIGSQIDKKLYIIYGTNNHLTLDVDLNNYIDGINGLIISSDLAGFGRTVSCFKSINNDIYNDFGIGSLTIASIIFGNNNINTINNNKTLDVSYFINSNNNNNNIKGFSFNDNGNQITAMSSVSDINNDTFNDIVITSSKVFILYGNSSFLNTYTSSNYIGFSIERLTSFDSFGSSVSSGDVNGDGIPDILLGSWYDSEAYIYFGKINNVNVDFINDASSLTKNDFVRFSGLNTEFFGTHIVGISDINGDNIDDILTMDNEYGSGEVFLFYGKTEFSEQYIDIDNYMNDKSNGLRIIGESTGDFFGRSISYGDFNGDDFIDIIIGASLNDPLSRTNAGTVYGFTFHYTPSLSVTKIIINDVIFYPSTLNQLIEIRNLHTFNDIEWRIVNNNNLTWVKEDNKWITADSNSLSSTNLIIDSYMSDVNDENINFNGTISIEWRYFFNTDKIFFEKNIILLSYTISSIAIFPESYTKTIQLQKNYTLNTYNNISNYYENDYIQIYSGSCDYDVKWNATIECDSLSCDWISLYELNNNNINFIKKESINGFIEKGTSIASVINFLIDPIDLYINDTIVYNIETLKATIKITINLNDPLLPIAYKFVEINLTPYLLCKPGSYSISGNTLNGCNLCDYNKYQNQYGQTFCETCPNNLPSTNNLGSTSINDCIKCSIGSYFNNGYCEKCPKGKYRSLNETSCLFCINNFEEVNEEQSGCIECEPGYIRYESNGFCERCPKKKYRSKDMTTCEFVENESYMVNNNNTGFELCGAGYINSNFRNSNNDQSCQPCPLDSFSGIYDNRCINCVEIDKNKPKTKNIGSKSKNDCTTEPGKILNDIGQIWECDSTKVDCTIGISKIDEVLIKDNYWRSSSKSTEIFECPYVNTCLYNNTCIEGHEGILCSVCSNGYAINFGENLCIECTVDQINNDNIRVSILVGTISGIFCFYVLTISIYNIKQHNYLEESENNNFFNEKSKIHQFSIILHNLTSSVKYNILIGFIQVAIAESYAIPPPESIQSFYSTIATILLDFQKQINFTCAYGGYSFFNILIFTCLVPIGLIILNIIFGYLIPLILYFNTITEEKKSQLSRISISRTAYILFLIYPSVNAIIFQSFYCKEFDTNIYINSNSTELIKEQYLVVDYSIKCYSNDHLKFIYASILFVFIYTFGVPLFYLRIISHMQVKKKSQIHIDKNQKIDVKFLTNPYKQDTIYHRAYEVIELIRKLLLGSLVIFYGSGADDVSQLAIVMMLLMFFLCIFAINNPYKDITNRNLQLLVHMGIFLINMIHLITRYDTNTKDYVIEILNSLIIVILLFVFILIFLAYIYEQYNKNIDTTSNLGGIFRSYTKNTTTSIDIMKSSKDKAKVEDESLVHMNL